jgi:hypothetical protein
MEKNQVIAKIMKVTKSKGTDKLDKLSDLSPEYLTLLLKTIENLNKVK